MCCIECDGDPCTCTPEQRFAKAHPNVTDQERDQIRKDALFERHQAKRDLALHREKVAAMVNRLRQVADALENPPATAAFASDSIVALPSRCGVSLISRSCKASSAGLVWRSA